MKIFVAVWLLSCAVALCYAQGFCIDPSIDIQNTLPGPELVLNGGFEEYGTYPWYPSDPEGFSISTFIPGACGDAAVIDTFYTRKGCPRNKAGLYQKVTLNQPSPKRVLVSAWASGVNVSGKPDVNFSLYVDVYFADGTTHYGVYVPFPFTTPGWNRVNLTVDETKPIQYIFVNLLFRSHTGTAYFDLVSVKEETIQVYPKGVNILTNPGFESCSLTNWTKEGGRTCQLQACGNDHVRTGTGSLSLGNQTLDSCFTQVSQLVYFNPPTTSKLTFSAYVKISYALLADTFNFVDLSIDDGVFNVNITNVDFVSTNGFQKFDVTLTPTSPLSVVRVQLLLQGKAQGVTYDDVSLVLS